MAIITTLTVKNRYPWKRSQEPVSSGLPLARALGLSDPSSFYLCDEQGKRIPAQFMPLAWWEDGVTIKWILVQFQTDVQANGEIRCVLHYALSMGGNRESEERFPIASQPGAGVELDTGVLKAVVNAEGGSVFQTLSIKGSDGWKPVLSEHRSMAPLLITPSGKRLKMGKPHDIQIEDNGSERAVVKLSGDYLFEEDHSGEAAFSYTIRIFAHRGRTELRMSHSLVCKAKEGVLEELAFHIPVEITTYTAGNDAGEANDFPRPTTGGVTGILQDSEKEYWVGNLHAGNQTVDVRQGRHLWWMAARNPGISVVTTVKYFYQRYPKSLEGHADRLQIGLLPGLSVNKDTFAPANQIKDHYVFIEGESRTHDMLVYFSDRNDDSAAIGRLAAEFHSPMLALAPWEWYTDSGALGDLAVRSNRYPVYEEAVDESLRIYLNRRDPMRLYGDRNFGDDGYVREGFWNNCEYDYVHTGMMHFLRGAGSSWYDDFSLPTVDHLLDIDICHAGEGRGKIHPHCDWHNSGTPKLGSHSWIRGMLEYYCFSGDFRARDAAVMIADIWSGSIIRSEGGETTERGIAWPCISMLAMYRTFPEKRYLEAARIMIEKFLAAQDPVEGDFRGSFSRTNTKDNWSTFLIGSPVLEALTLYIETTGDERYKDVVVRAAKRLARINWLEDKGAWEYTISTVPQGTRAHNAKTDKMVTPGVIYAYLYSGDEDLLEKAVSAFRYSESVPAVDGKDLAQMYCFGARIPALLDKALEMQSSQ